MSEITHDPPKAATVRMWLCCLRNRGPRRAVRIAESNGKPGTSHSRICVSYIAVLPRLGRLDAGGSQLGHLRLRGMQPRLGRVEIQRRFLPRFAQVLPAADV